MKRSVPLVISLLALALALSAHPQVLSSAYAAAAQLVTGKQIADGAIAERHLKPKVRTKLNDATPGGPAGGVLTGSYPDPGLAAGSVDGDAVDESTLGAVPDADRLGGVGADGYQRACETGVLRGAAEIVMSNLSTTEYTTAGVQKTYMCVPGTIYAKRNSTGIATVVFHPAGQSGQFGASIGGYPVVNPYTTGPAYMVNVNGPTAPGDPPATFTSVLAYRVQIVDDAGTPVNQSVRLTVF